MDIAARAEWAGVVVTGGRPLHDRLRRSIGTILSGCVETEPLSGAARAVVCAHPAEVFAGLTLAMEATRATRGLFVVPRGDREVREAVGRIARDFAHVQVEAVEPYHPLENPRVLAREVLGTHVPADTPLEAAGVLVVDPQALWHLAAAAEGRPVTHRFVTVAGEVARPATVRVPIGTLLEDLAALCGGVTGKVPVRFLKGGPLTGRLVSADDTVGREDSAVSILAETHPAVVRAGIAIDQMLARARSVCGACRLCTDLCPEHAAGHAIHPHLLMRALTHGMDTIDDVVLGAATCSGCMACSAACPAGIAPGRFYAAVRASLEARGVHHPPAGRLQNGLEGSAGRRATRARLAAQLGVSRYDRRWPVDDNYPAVDRVRLSAGPGGVKVGLGQQVEMGDLVAEQGPDGLPVHAPIRGVVSRLMESVTAGPNGASGRDPVVELASV